jgi:hypothetical protein
MGFLVVLLLLFIMPNIVPPLVEMAQDPSPGITLSKAESRRLECERTTLEHAGKLFSGEVAKARPRGEFIERSAMICAETIMQPHQRAPLDHAILNNLENTIDAIATLAHTRYTQHHKKLWHVESFYPNPQVASKLAFALKNALVTRGLKVSDQTPTLAFGDIDVLSRLPPDESYPLACQRYLAAESLSNDDVLISLVLRDRRETILHAGLCANGQWQWIH